MRINASGLGKDFRGLAFGPMPELLAQADKITKLQAVCLDCAKDAICTQRLINGKAAHYNEPIIQIASEE